jgi:hypothetical protein
METCYGVKINASRQMREGTREWSFPSFSFYAGRKHGQLQTTTNHYAATPMTQSLAEQLAARLKLVGMEATVCDLFADPETVIHDTVIDIDEDVPPPVATASSYEGRYSSQNG